MAEKTAVFRRMIGGQRGFAVGIVALFAEFFRLFFVHGKKTFVLLVVGQKGRGFGRGAPQKEKDAAAEEKENEIVDDGFF
jgi:hypothetical protein